MCDVQKAAEECEPRERETVKKSEQEPTPKDRK